MIRLMKTCVLLAFLFFCSCVSTSIELEPKNNRKLSSFDYYSHYGLWGLVGSDFLDMRKICVNSEAVRVENYFNFENLLFALITAGLYTPKSTRIWCSSLEDLTL